MDDFFLVSIDHWPRMSKYEWVRQGEEIFIRPIAQAHLQEYYSPFDKDRKRLLEEFLNTAASLELARSIPDSPEEIVAAEERDAEKIIEWYNQWGCLGLLWRHVGKHSYPPPKKKTRKIKHRDLPSKVLLLDEYRRLGPGVVDYHEYVQLFLTDDEGAPPVGDVFSFQKDFLRRYSEPVFDIVKVFGEILDAAEKWERFKRGKFEPQESVIFGDEAVTIKQRLPWGSHLRELTEVWPISLGLFLEQNIRKIRYSFDSLYSVLKVLHLEFITSKEQNIGKCEREGCSKWWVSQRAHNRRYCSARCRETAKKRRQRER